MGLSPGERLAAAAPRAPSGSERGAALWRGAALCRGSARLFHGGITGVGSFIKTGDASITITG